MKRSDEKEHIFHSIAISEKLEMACSILYQIIDPKNDLNKDVISNIITGLKYIECAQFNCVVNRKGTWVIKPHLMLEIEDESNKQ